MSSYSPVSVNWRGPRSQHGFLNQAYDPAQSFAYTSVYSGVRAVKKLDNRETQNQVGIVIKWSRYDIDVFTF